MKKKEMDLFERLKNKGISRREFMKFCTALTATMGLSSSMVPTVSEVFAAPRQRPPVIWIHLGECTGCSESFLRTIYPYIDEIILELVSVEYHEIIMAAAGDQAEQNLKAAVKKHQGKYICIVEGAVATKFNGAYGKVSNHTFLDIAKNVCLKAAHVICIGTCSSFGGIPAAKPNPGGYKGIGEALNIKPLNLPGCPTNPINLAGTLTHYLLLDKLPAMDNLGRPDFAYGQTIHDTCPRRSHFEEGDFVEEFGSEEARLGYCLYKLGCKGPETYNNCATAKYNDGTSWPIEAGHPCIGCSQPNFWDDMTPFYEAS